MDKISVITVQEHFSSQDIIEAVAEYQNINNILLLTETTKETLISLIKQILKESKTIFVGNGKEHVLEAMRECQKEITAMSVFTSKDASEFRNKFAIPSGIEVIQHGEIKQLQKWFKSAIALCLKD